MVSLMVHKASIVAAMECGQLYQVMSAIRDLSRQGSDLAGVLFEQKDVDDIDRIGGVANHIIKRVMDKSDSLRKDLEDG